MNPNANNYNETRCGYIASSLAIEIVKKTFVKGNFSLWYNKYIPILINGKKDELYKPCNTDINKKNEFTEYYALNANSFYKGINDLLFEKHARQSFVLDCAMNKGLEVIEIWAQNTTRLLTGVGNSHPAEISITLDHNLGVPYIPASSIKGIVRFCNALGLREKLSKDSFNDVEDPETKELFGSSPEDYKGDLKKGHEQKGSIVFLDVYPLPTNVESNIELEVDILNPHYIKYYSPTNTKDWPSDNQDPRPVKFLVVKPGTYFIFRCIVPTGKKEKIIELFRKVFVEGIGAKTTLNYGRFKEINPENPSLKSLKEKIEETKRSLFNTTATFAKEIPFAEESGPEVSVLNKIKKLNKDRGQIGQLVKEIIEGDYTLEVYETLKKKLIDLNEWEPQPGNSYSKMLDRKNRIETKIKSLKEKGDSTENA